MQQNFRLQIRTLPRSGHGGFGGGSGGAKFDDDRGLPGAFAGGGGSGYGQRVGGGGGAALGGAVFVRASNGASLTWTDSSTDTGSVIGGASGGGNASPGLGVGSSLFLLGGTTTFTINNGTKTIGGSLGVAALPLN